MGPHLSRVVHQDFPRLQIHLYNRIMNIQVESCRPLHADHSNYELYRKEDLIEDQVSDATHRGIDENMSGEDAMEQLAKLGEMGDEKTKAREDTGDHGLCTSRGMQDPNTDNGNLVLFPDPQNDIVVDETEDWSGEKRQQRGTDNDKTNDTTADENSTEGRD